MVVVDVVVQPSLVQACFNGDPDEVRAILYKKEDVNYQVLSDATACCRRNEDRCHQVGIQLIR